MDYYQNNNLTKYLARSLHASDCLRFGKFPPQICESFDATYKRNCVTFSALQRKSNPLTNGENSVQIDA